jgi:hypothetical protein
MKVYMIIWETSFGPFFTTREKAVEHLDKECNGVKWPNAGGYPDIEEIELDSGIGYFDR